ncbi:amidohydrolase family protein, partial [Myxococcota bacterium]|nr:amidohydrolase family protein [Myxococcota bacterium]
MQTSSEAWLIQNAEIDGRRGDLRVRGGVIHAIGVDFEAVEDERTLDARGGALIRGLNDHHTHLLALSAALNSIRCGPPEVIDEKQLSEALHRAAQASPAGHWLRGVGYHESVAGDLDRSRLDQLGPRRPIRIQHRSGARWILNSEALQQIAPSISAQQNSPLEKDSAGRPTGRLDRADHWLRDQIQSTPPDLAQVSALLSQYGVTGCSDATPDNGPETVA